MFRKTISILSMVVIVGASMVYFAPTTNAAAETISCNAGGSRTITQGTYTDSDGTEFTSGADLTLNVGTGGSCTFTFNGSMTLASLTIGSGVTLAHGDNSTAQTNTLEVNATGNIDIQSGASINLDHLGYSGGGNFQNGYGPGKGFGGGGSQGTGGGAHGGDGGDGMNGDTPQYAGGDGYCDVSDVNTIGSGGAGGSSGGLGGDGGGLVRLLSGGTLSIDGTITADGENGAGGYGSAGAGGGIYLSADIIDGTPTSITATGGSATFRNAGGGGGCAYIEYTTSSTIDASDLNVLGGSSTGDGETGGSGTVLLKQTGTNGELSLVGRDSDVTTTKLNPTSLTVDTVVIDNYAILDVESGSTLTMGSVADPISGDGTGTIEINGDFVSSNMTTLSGTILNIYNNWTNNALITVSSDATLDIHSTAVLSTGIDTFTNSGDSTVTYGATFSITDLNIDDGAFRLESYDISNSLSLEEVVINGGILTHADNGGSQSHVLHISANDIIVNSGGSINVDEVGYNGGAVYSTGSGPGPGIGSGSNQSAGGGAHGGDGGDADNAGGTAYCTVSDISTMGSGGGGGSGSSQGGAGGGLIKLIVTNTITIDGSISADGGNGYNGYGAGGAGGGIRIEANAIAGSPSSFTASGGNAGGTHGAGGGGGCVQLNYSSSSVEAGDISVSGGSPGANEGTAGTIGLTELTLENTAPTVSVALASTGQETDGSGYYNFTFSVDDSEGHNVDVQVECGDNSYADIDIANSNLGSVDNGAATYQITNISTAGGEADVQILIDTQSTLNDVDISTFQCRVTPYDGIDVGTSSELTGLDLDNEEPDPNTDATIALVTDVNSDGIAAVGDTFQLTAGTENTGDTVTWQLKLTNITGQESVPAGVETDPIIPGLFEATDIPVTFEVIDDMGNDTDVDTANVISIDQVIPVITDNGTLTITRDNNADGIASIGDGLTLSGVTLDAADGDVITIDYDTVGGLLEVLMDAEGYVGAGAVDGSTTFTINVEDNAGNTVSTTSDAVDVYNIAHTIGFAAAASSAEETEGTVTVTVDLDSSSGVDTTVDYTLGGTATAVDDYTLAGDTVTILAGASSFDIDVPLIDDLDEENEETLILTLSNPGEATLGAVTEHTLTITSDEVPSRSNKTTGSIIETVEVQTQKVTPSLSTSSLPNLSGHWAEEELNELVAKNVVSRSVKPDEPIDREEAVRIVLKALDIDFEGSAIQAALDEGIIEQERPEDPATRAEILKIIFNSVSLKYVDSDPTSHFNDVFESDWFYVLINFAFEEEVVKGYPDASFKPHQVITAAEVAKLLKKTVNQ